MKKLTKTYKVTLTFNRPVKDSDESIQDTIVDSLVDTFGYMCFDDNDDQTSVTEVKVTK